MSMDGITLAQMLAAMDTGATFSIKYIGFDRKRKERNGRTIEFKEARLEKSVRSDDDDFVIRSKKTSHFTRTIRLYASGRPTTETRLLHPVLVEQFDGKEVFL